MTRYYLKRTPDGEPFGPLSVPELRELSDKGGLPSGARVCEVGGERWVPVSSVPALGVEPESAGAPFGEGAIFLFSLCTPFAALGMYIAWKDKHPAAAAAATRWGILSLVLWMILGCLLAAWYMEQLQAVRTY